MAKRLGRSAGKFAKAARSAARRAQPEVERVARQARPEAERLARQAKPAVERAGRFVREHDDEIRQATSTSARMVVNRSTHPLLRPFASMVVDGFARGSKGKQAEERSDTPEEQSS